MNNSPDNLTANSPGRSDTLQSAIFVLVYLTAAIAIMLEWGNQLFQPYYIDGVVLVSAVYFVLLLLLSSHSLRFFYLLTPVVVISVPNAINDLLPAYAMAPLSDLGAAHFAFFTHIDLYLLFGIIFHGARSGSERPGAINPTWMFVVLAAYLGGYLYAMWSDQRSLGGFAVWAFQYRYILLAMAFVSLPSLQGQRVWLMLWGLYLATLLNIVESILFTEFRLGGLSEHRLTSGNLGHNAFGNYLAAVAMVSYAHYSSARRMESPNQWVLAIFFLVFTSAAFLTDTRMSALALLASLILFHLAFYRIVRLSALVPVVVAMFVLMSPLGISNLQNVGEYVGEVLPKVVDEAQRASVNDAPVTTETATTQTRMILWRGAWQMIQENPLYGVGAGEWNFVKSRYAIHWDTMLDSHNDYLHYLACSGLIVGCVFILFLYATPWITALKLAYQDRMLMFRYCPFLVFSITLSMCSLSNSNSHKHQIFTMLALFAMMALRYRAENVAEDPGWRYCAGIGERNVSDE